MELWTAFVHLLEQVLLTLFGWTGSAGLSIIIFTVIARLLILPLTIKGLQSSRKMQALQPLMKELQRKYGKEPQKLQEETMKLYREYKINPAGGCLPMLLQLPIFFGVYQAVINLTRVTVAEQTAETMISGLASAGVSIAGLPQHIGQPLLNGSFLWLPTLGVPDPLYILPVLSVILQLLVQLMSTPRIQDPQQKAMMQSMLIMPVVFGYIGFTFPSGAVLYWVVGSVLSIIQTYMISGWGSLANYLKFLPTDGGLFPPPIPAAATVGATAGTSAVPTSEASGPRDFWDVLRPLTDDSKEPQADIEQEDDATQQAIADAKRQANQFNPRRRRPRR